MKILITGASGFIGRHLIPALRSYGHNVCALSRSADPSANYASLVRSKIDSADAIVHLAGIAHRTGTSNSDYDRYNHLLTKEIADISSDNELKHFIFLSTAKVHGDRSTTPFNSASPVKPEDAYSDSKAKAEAYLSEIKSKTKFTSLRPPVVYGGDPKANIAKLSKRILENKIIPVPSKPNVRSFVSIDNLTRAVIASLESNLVNQRHKYHAYLVDDRNPVSTEEFIRTLSFTLNRKPKLLRVPNSVFLTADITLNKLMNINSLAPMHRDFEIRCNLLENETKWVSQGSLKSNLAKMVSSSSWTS